MFGIGLPELIVILGVALIVVGPEKLPELAKSLARGINELKKTATALKESLAEEDAAKNQDRPGLLENGGGPAPLDLSGDEAAVVEEGAGPDGEASDVAATSAAAAAETDGK